MMLSSFIVYLYLMICLEVMKDDNQSLGERATAAKDAASNKMEETKHDVGVLLCSSWPNTNQAPTQTKSEADKQAAKN